ncbi:MAG TPA: PKD domain-containing protein, partial [Segetibacter sp.]
DGVKATNLVKGFYYEFAANDPKSIVADKPVMVAQYITSTNECANNFNDNGDPEMIFLSPVEQTIDQITLNSTGRYEIRSHFINVIIKSSGVAGFTLDGKSSNAFRPHPKDPAYSFATFEVTKGAHNLKASEGFNAIAYGYGATESYGYNAGTNIKDLYQFITISTKYASVNAAATCTNTPFQFTVTLPYQPTSLTWDFGNNPNLSPSDKVVRNNPVADSTYRIDGRDVYAYRLPAFYQFNATGIFPVKIIADNQSSDGCNGLQQISYDVEVSAPPVADFTISQSGCSTDSVTFIDASGSTGKPVTRWRWLLGDGTTDTLQNAKKSYSNAGSYTITHTAINNIGCFTDITKTLSIEPQPIAKFGIAGAPCVASAITFIDSSSIPTGAIAKRYWDFGDGTTRIETANIPVSHVYLKEGTYTISLQVENNSGCKSVAFIKTITTKANPKPDFSISNVCLPGGNATFLNVTTMNDGSEATLSYLWQFGDGSSSLEKNPTHIYKSAGPFSITLRATSASGCSADTTKALTNIFAKPVADFATSSNLCVANNVLFSDKSSASNNSVKEWSWSFGNGSTSKLQNPEMKYPSSGTFEVSLFVKSEAGCFSDTVKRIITISAL